MLQFLQKLTNFFAFGDVQSRTNDGFNFAILIINHIVEVFLVDDTNDVVHGFLVHGQTGVIGFCKNLGNFFFSCFGRNTYDVNTRSQDINSFLLAELDGATNQGAFLLVNSAFLFRFLYDGKQFFFCDGIVVFCVEDFGQQLLPLFKQEVEGGQYNHQQI